MFNWFSLSLCVFRSLLFDFFLTSLLCFPSFFNFSHLSFRSQSNDLRNSPKEIGVFNENTRKFNGAKDVSRDFSNSQDNTDRGSMSDQAFACSASSVESLPSASGSSKSMLFSNILITFRQNGKIDDDNYDEAVVGFTMGGNGQR